MNLLELRDKIDGLDAQIVELLKQRAAFVHEVGEIKKKTNSPIFVPERECAMAEKLLRLNAGVLPEHGLLSIYRQIVSCSFFLEGGMKVGFLGPDGTWSHQAALSRFGESVGMHAYPSFEETFRAVSRQEVDYGVIPIENSTDGSVSQAMDLLGSSNLQICAQVHLPVNNCLLSNIPIEEIKRIYSHPQVLGQCRDWLLAHLPKAELIPMSSTAVAAKVAAAEANCGSAALGSRLTAELHGLTILKTDIQDKYNNTTRFVIIGRHGTAASGRDRTTICFSVPHSAGSLVNVLDVLRQHGVNIYSIASRPTRETAWEYLFYLDLEGHRDDETLQISLATLKSQCPFFKVLGSYPEL